jgi:hypothetical protein
LSSALTLCTIASETSPRLSRSSTASTRARKNGFSWVKLRTRMRTSPSTTTLHPPSGKRKIWLMRQSVPIRENSRNGRSHGPEAGDQPEQMLAAHRLVDHRHGRRLDKERKYHVRKHHLFPHGMNGQDRRYGKGLFEHSAASITRIRD